MGKYDGDLKNQCTHKLKHYREIITSAQDLKYEFAMFKNYKQMKSENVIILRHDVDWRLDNGFEMAKVERDCGVRSTFFIRPHAIDYNPFEYKSYAILKQLLNWGFEIGLHFEVVDMNHVTGEDELELFRKEKKVLETILDIKIVSAAAHGGYSGLDYYGKNYFFNKHTKEDVKIENHTFEERFWYDMKYLSDGYGLWREGCPCKYVTGKGRLKKLHINTHPKWWFDNFFYFEPGSSWKNG